jgi:hypothetical protein
MPFPFLAAALPAIGTALFGTVTATAVTLGTAAAVGVVTAAAIGIRNDEVRDRARRAAKARASREQERINHEEKESLVRKEEKLHEKFGEKIPETEAKEFAEACSKLLGDIEGNRLGLEKQGLQASSQAQSDENQLEAYYTQGNIKK